MPQYFAYRERKGIKLPANKIGGQSTNKYLMNIRGDCARIKSWDEII